MATEQPAADHTDDIQREIGHDEYNPVGPLALVFIYFVIVSMLWIFVYFVEFLGRISPMVVF